MWYERKTFVGRNMNPFFLTTQDLKKLYLKQLYLNPFKFTDTRIQKIYSKKISQSD